MENIMNGRKLLQIGGITNALFVVFHLSFWSIFDWRQSLASLSLNNRAILEVLNIHTAYTLAVFAAVSLAFPDELTTTKLGRSLSMAIAVFWILRAVNQAIFWGISSIICWVFIALCLGIAMLYLVPLYPKSAENKL